MPKKRRSSENTRNGGNAKKPRVDRDERNDTAVSPTSSSHGDDSPAISPGDEEVRDQPPAWADGRYSLCSALPWFRSVQGGSYQSNKLCYGFLLDRDGGPRDLIDDEIVITRVGGDCKLDANGNLKQHKNQDENTRVVESLRESKKSGLAVGLIIGDKNTTIGRQLPHRYNVMAWFCVVDVWFEKTGNNKVGARVRFQKLDLEKPSWWAGKGSEDPLPLSQKMLIESQSETCRTCGESSMLTYESGWMCLRAGCERFWTLKSGNAPSDLAYNAVFLNSREPSDDQIQPQFSLVPDPLADLSEYPDAWTHRVAWRGVVCPKCDKCISRNSWNSWVCNDPLRGNSQHPGTCQWEIPMPMPVFSLRSVLADLEIGVTKRGIRTDKDALIQPNNYFTKPYQIVTYDIGDIGRIVQFSANRSTLKRPNGPNELFIRLQEVDLGLRRYPVRRQFADETLTSHFSVNFGMPYKYVVSVDSKGFDEAPAEIMFALGRLNWATKRAVGTGAREPNELLAVGYFEDMSMGFHDDGEDSLGPSIATLSLGSQATMRFRLKKKYYNGNAANDAVLPGCEFFEERKELKEQHDKGELNDAEYSNKCMDLTNDITRREAKDLITLDLHHGDMVVMHGALLQKYYEHSITSEGKLRFALTARHVLDEKLTVEERAKGQYKFTPDQIYEGE